MKILVFDDPEAAAQRGAVLVESRAHKAIGEKGYFSVALSGGRTPWRMMSLIAARPLPWQSIQIFQTDERVVPPDDRERTLAQLRVALLSQVPLAPQNVHPMPVDAEDLASASQAYQKSLEQIAGQPPVLDLIHLGLGGDGHAASLIPGDPVLNIVDADVAISGYYQGHRRMTLTYPALNRARAILWLVTGDTKAEILRRLIAGDGSIPAGQVERARAVVIADKAAARLLPKSRWRNDAGAF